MKRKNAGVLRRTKHLKNLATIDKQTKSLGRSIVGMMMNVATAPLSALTPIAPKAAKAKIARSKHGRSLRIVVSQLRTARALMPAAIPTAPPQKCSPLTPKGAQFGSRNHRGVAGSRSYKLFLPAPASRHPQGLVIMLHGCNQTPDDFAVGTHMNAVAQKHGLAVAYPAQTRSQNPASCWNWFLPSHQSRNAGEPAILAALTRKLMKEFGLDRESVFVAGLSAGGAMAAILAEVYPDLFSAVGVHSGLARGAASNTMSAMLAMQNRGTFNGAALKNTLQKHIVRWIIFQGDSDQTVHPSNAENLLSAVVGQNAQPTRTVAQSVRGRSYIRTKYAAPGGGTLVENWTVQATGHAWSGGRANGSYTDTKGPDASAQMIRFFLTKPAR